MPGGVGGGGATAEAPHTAPERPQDHPCPRHHYDLPPTSSRGTLPRGRDTAWRSVLFDSKWPSPPTVSICENTGGHSLGTYSVPGSVSPGVSHLPGGPWGLPPTAAQPASTGAGIPGQNPRTPALASWGCGNKGPLPGQQQPIRSSLRRPELPDENGDWADPPRCSEGQGPSCNSSCWGSGCPRACGRSPLLRPAHPSPSRPATCVSHLPLLAPSLQGHLSLDLGPPLPDNPG